MNWLVRGGLDGLVAAGAHTAVMYAGKATGLLQTPPPKEITHRAGEETGAHPRKEGEGAFTLSWLGAHVGFGVICGVVFTILRRLIPGRTLFPGIVFGLGVWGVSYLGVLPALGLYPDPAEDSDSRTAVMIAAHIAFGLTAATTDNRLRGE